MANNNKWLTKAQWNFLKAQWIFQTELDTSVSKMAELDLTCPTSINDTYQIFCKLIWVAANKLIPRGYCRQYIPRWWSEAIKLYQKFKSAGDKQEFIQLLDQTRRDRWTDSESTKIDCSHSSRLAWQTIKRLFGDYSTLCKKGVSSHHKCIPASGHTQNLDQSSAMQSKLSFQRGSRLLVWIQTRWLLFQTKNWTRP